MAKEWRKCVCLFVLSVSLAVGARWQCSGSHDGARCKLFRGDHMGVSKRALTKEAVWSVYLGGGVRGSVEDDTGVTGITVVGVCAL